MLEQRLGHGSAWAEAQRGTVPKCHVHTCFKRILPLVCQQIVCMRCSPCAGLSLVLCLSMQNFAPVSGLAWGPYNSNASLGFQYAAPNSWQSSGLQATACPYQQQGPYQLQGQSWNSTQPNPTQFHQLIQQQNRNHQFNFANTITAPNYQAQQGWSPLTDHSSQQPDGSAAIQAPLAPQVSYASIAKSAAYQAVSGPERTAKKQFSASLNAEQAIRLVKRAARWQDSDCIPGVMIAKDGEPLTQEIFQKMIVKLAEPIRCKSLSKSQQGLEMSEINAIPLGSTLGISVEVHVASTEGVAPLKRELKTWDELSLRRREARLKLGVDHLRAALETLREVVGMCDEDLQPSSLDELLAAVLEKGVEHSVQPLSLSHKSVPGVWAEKIIAKAMKNLEHEHRVVMLDGWSGLLVGHGLNREP